MQFPVARIGRSAWPLAIALLSCAGDITLRAHGTDARRVVELAWTRDHITRTLAANRSELGLNGSKAPEDMMTIDGRSCVFGDLFVFDVDDQYAFDIDEDVDVTVTYAPDRTQPFAVAWDRKPARVCARRRSGSIARASRASAC